MKVPVLVLIYNRVDITKKLFNILKMIKPKILYIAADGPKDNNSIDEINCHKTRKIFNSINWKCKILHKYNEKNKGLKKSVLESINWFFQNEKFGIILEDDCIPSLSFFKFCENLLYKYKNNKKIFCISGSNHSFENTNSKYSYYFSKYPHCWGWATWRRAWKKNNPNINYWPNYKKSKNWNNIHNSDLEKKYWERIFNKTYLNYFDSWAYSWTLSVWKNKGCTIIPNKNLIKNIGLGINSTNSLFRKKKEIKSVWEIKDKIMHPASVKIDSKNDDFVFKNHYKGKNFIYPYRIIHILKILLTNPYLILLKLKNNYN
jgi:hypothetical protein